MFLSKIELSEMLAENDFNIQDIGIKKIIVYIIMQDGRSVYDLLSSTFIKQSYEMLVKGGCNNKDKKTLPIKVNYVLDGLGNFPLIKDISDMVITTNYNIRLHITIQSLEQLSAQYGGKVTEIVKTGCANWFFLGSKEIQLLKDISELCGNIKVKTRGDRNEEKTLISVSELRRLKMGEVLIMYNRERPYKTYMPDISDYTNWENVNCDEETIIKRNKIHVFNVQRYIEQLKNEKRSDVK